MIIQDVGYQSAQIVVPLKISMKRKNNLKITIIKIVFSKFLRFELS